MKKFTLKNDKIEQINEEQATYLLNKIISNDGKYIVMYNGLNYNFTIEKKYDASIIKVHGYKKDRANVERFIGCINQDGKVIDWIINYNNELHYVLECLFNNEMLMEKIGASIIQNKEVKQTKRIKI